MPVTASLAPEAPHRGTPGALPEAVTNAGGTFCRPLSWPPPAAPAAGPGAAGPGAAAGAGKLVLRWAEQVLRWAEQVQH